MIYEPAGHRGVATRRDLIRGLAAAGTWAALTGRKAHAGLAECGPLGKVMEPRPQRAVSLRALSDALRKIRIGNPIYTSLLRMEGITRLDGYVLDPSNRDIVLWGIVEPGTPALDFRDFAIAMRHAHGRYHEIRDGVTYASKPLISIDPDPDVFAKLRKINLVPDSKRDDEKVSQLYKRVCASQQKVRVEGIPQDCRAAKVLVEADYRMKQVSQGSVKLPISSPFPSDAETSWAASRAELLRGRKGRPVNTRYWFTPHRFHYQASPVADTVFLSVAEIALRDEDQMLTGGELVASGKTNEFARSFTCAWTERMEDIYKAEPIWRDMHNVFRHFAIAKILAERGGLLQVGFDSTVILDSFQTRSQGPPQTLAGLGFVARETHGATRLANAVCGGVSIDFNESNFAVDLTGDPDATGSSGSTVLASRPGTTAVAWMVDASKRLAPDVEAYAPLPPSAVEPKPESIGDILKKRTKK